MKNRKLHLNPEQEINTIETMIKMYCHGHRHARNESALCEECQQLLEYSKTRIIRCPRKEEKTFCNTCPIHCYQPVYRARIKDVMKYSGPRLLYRHPVLAIKHALNTLLSI